MQACTNIDIGVIAGESIRTTVAGGFVRSRRDLASNADRDGAVTSAVLARGAEKRESVPARARNVDFRPSMRGADVERHADHQTRSRSWQN